MSIYRGSSALRQEHELAVVEEGEPDLGRRQGLGSADAAVRPGQGAAEGAGARDVMKPVAGPQFVSSALTQQRYIIRHRTHVAGFLSPYFLIQFEQFHPGRRGRKSPRSRTCRQSRTGDRRKLQPAHQELHHLLELSLHDPPARGCQNRGRTGQASANDGNPLAPVMGAFQPARGI